MHLSSREQAAIMRGAMFLFFGWAENATSGGSLLALFLQGNLNSATEKGVCPETMTSRDTHDKYVSRARLKRERNEKLL